MDVANHPEKVGEKVGSRKRERRSVEQRREIAEASLQAGVSVQEIARAYGVNRRQVYSWRKQYRRGLPSDKPSAALLRVQIAEAGRDADLDGSSRGGSVAIELRGARVTISGSADVVLVRAVLECLGG